MARSTSCGLVILCASPMSITLRHCEWSTISSKTEFISANHEVCFQVEEIVDPSQWRSVMLIGEAHRITKPEEMERAMQLISERNSTLTPALNKTEIGAWHRLNQTAIYCVQPSAIYGRQTSE